MSARNKSIIEIFQALLEANKKIELLEQELNSYKENKMRKIYLATSGSQAICAYDTKEEALEKCLELAKTKKDDYLQHFEEKSKVNEVYKITTLEGSLEGYSFMFSFYYVVSVDYVNR